MSRWSPIKALLLWCIGINCHLHIHQITSMRHLLQNNKALWSALGKISLTLCHYIALHQNYEHKRLHLTSVLHRSDSFVSRYVGKCAFLLLFLPNKSLHIHFDEGDAQGCRQDYFETKLGQSDRRISVFVKQVKQDKSLMSFHRNYETSGWFNRNIIAGLLRYYVGFWAAYFFWKLLCFPCCTT